MKRTEVPVLVAGGGPVGLCASAFLSRQGIDHLVIDRRDGPHRAPQAHVVNPRTLEICRRTGIDMERLRALATPACDGSHVRWLTTLTGEEIGRVPYERQGDENLRYTPTPLLNLSQHLFEPVLLDHVRAQSCARVRYRTQWESLEQSDDGVLCTVVDLDSGEKEEIHSRYVLAADGAGSRIRKALGVAMLGPDALQSFIMIHFEADLRALVAERPAILYWILDPGGPGTFVAHDIDKTWVFMRPFDRDAESIDDYDAGRCRAIVHQAMGTDEVEIEVRDVSPWTMTAQIADSYRGGRVFLVGDSAHRFPPTGGMGMNTGIQDAHNLVWKIAMVERGGAPAQLLDSYEIERRPVAEENCRQSLDNALKMIELFEALGLTENPQESAHNMAAALADPVARRRVATAIEHQQDHFDMFGLQLGFVYERGCIVPDGSEPVRAVNATRDYIPSTRPGSKIPHAWIETAGGRRSILDLIDEVGFTLIADDDGAEFARELAASMTGVGVTVLVAGRDFSDVDAHWWSAKEGAAARVLLVRPDQHVAWRCGDVRPVNVVDVVARIDAALGMRTD